MLATCVLHHIKVESPILHTVTKLEYLKLTLRCFVVLFGEISEDVIHVLHGVLLSHIIGNLSVLQL